MRRRVVFRLSEAPRDRARFVPIRLGLGTNSRCVPKRRIRLPLRRHGRAADRALQGLVADRIHAKRCRRWRACPRPSSPGVPDRDPEYEPVLTRTYARYAWRHTKRSAGMSTFRVAMTTY